MTDVRNCIGMRARRTRPTYLTYDYDECRSIYDKSYTDSEYEIVINWVSPYGHIGYSWGSAGRSHDGVLDPRWDDGESYECMEVYDNQS